MHGAMRIARGEHGRRIGGRRGMTSRIVLVCLAGLSCTVSNWRPSAAGSGTLRPEYPTAYEVRFEAYCDSCRVQYGAQGETELRVARGDWSASLLLALREGELQRVVLDVRPYGAGRVASARILVGGEVMASGSSDEEGGPVSLRARIGGE